MRRSISPAILLGMAGLMFLAAPQTAQLASPGTVKIPDSTVVRLSLMDTLNSGTNDVDDPVHMEVTEDIKVGDVVVIPRGSTATGHVIEAEGKKRMGRGGKLSFTVDSVKAVDGSNIRLRSSSTRKGNEKTGGVVAAAVIVSPLFLLMHGKDVNIPKGTEFNAYIDGDREVTLGGPASTSGGSTTGGSTTGGTTAPTQPSSPGQDVELSTVVVKSTPDGADILVDGKYVGSTPSTVRLPPGDHAISVEKSGFKSWQRTMTASSGSIVTVDATLEKVQ